MGLQTGSQIYEGLDGGPPRVFEGLWYMTRPTSLSKGAALS